MLDLLKQFGGWVVGLIVIAIACAILGALGYTGMLVRKGARWPIFVWAGIYLILFFVLTPIQFLLSLLAFIAPILGFFGIFFVPDVD